LPLRDLNGLQKTLFSFLLDFGLALTCFGLACDLPWTCLGLKRKRSFQPIQLRLVVPLPSFVHVGQRLGQQGESFFCPSRFPIRLRECFVNEADSLGGWKPNPDVRTQRI